MRYVLDLGGGAGGGSGGDVPREGGTGNGSPFPGNLADSVPSSGWGHDGGTNTSSNTNRGAGGGGAAGAGEGAPSTPGSLHGADGGLAIQIPATFRNPQSVTALGGLGPTSAPTPNGYDTSGKFYFAGGGGGAGWQPAPGSKGLGGVGNSRFDKGRKNEINGV